MHKKNRESSLFEKEKKTRAARRRNNVTKALRKRWITEAVYGMPREKTDPESGPWYESLHQFSKNKVHCSCPMCSAKTRNRKRFAGVILNFSVSDQKKVEALNFGEREYFVLPDEMQADTSEDTCAAMEEKGEKRWQLDMV